MKIEIEKQEKIAPKAKCKKWFKEGELDCRLYYRSGQIRYKAGIIHSLEQEESQVGDYRNQMLGRLGGWRR